MIKNEQFLKTDEIPVEEKDNSPGSGKIDTEDMKGDKGDTGESKSVNQTSLSPLTGTVVGKPFPKINKDIYPMHRTRA